MTITNGAKVKVDIKSEAFTLNLGGVNLWEKKNLKSETIIQSPAIDYKNKQIFLAQSSAGATNPDKGGTQGDIDINVLNYDTTKKLVMELKRQQDWNGKNYLDYNTEFNEYNYYKEGVKGWGHATQIGLEYAPDGTYVWVDYDSECVDRVFNKSKGLSDFYVVGKVLARIPVEKGVFLYNDKRVRTFTLNKRIPGLVKSDFATVSIDNVNGVLGVKYYNENNIMKVSLFDIEYTKDYLETKYMSDIKFTLIKTFDAPVVKWPKASKTGNAKKVYTNLTPNGWALFGDYVYFLHGTAYWSPTTATGQTDFYSPTKEMIEKGCYKFVGDEMVKETKLGNTHISCMNWKTLENETFHTEVAKSLAPFREPEGMAMIPTLDKNGNVTNLKLVIGFANGVPGDRNWTLMYKENNIG